MAKFTVKEISKDATFEIDSHHSIIIETGSSSMTYKLVKPFLENLDKVTKIIHYRDKSPGFYQTIFIAGYDKILIKGGLGSGYRGEGPRTFCDVLQYLGIACEESEAFIMNPNIPNRASITIELS